MTDCAQCQTYRAALANMACQFACWARGGLVTSGLSALEEAFEVLGWSEPHKVPEMVCDEPGCDEEATCGIPTPAGYRRVCGRCYRALKET